MDAQRYRKRPVEVEAMQFDGTLESASAIATWANADDAAGLMEDPTLTYLTSDALPGAAFDMVVWTAHGDAAVNKGDWVIRGESDFYPCKPDAFDKLYEKV